MTGLRQKTGTNPHFSVNSFASVVAFSSPSPDAKGEREASLLLHQTPRANERLLFSFTRRQGRTRGTRLRQRQRQRQRGSKKSDK
jgi:hypothetical protein